MYVIVWEFQVAAARAKDFERAYGPDGDWTRFFQRAPAFRGAELLWGTGDDADDADEASSDPVYWTVDRWDSREAYEDFNTRFEREYEELDTRLADLCELEVCLGKFEVVD